MEEVILNIFWRATEFDPIDISGEYIYFKRESGKYSIESWQEDRFAEYNFTGLLTKEEFNKAKEDVLYLDGYRINNNQTIYEDNWR